MTNDQHFPSKAQSIGIVGIMFGGMLLLSPVNIFLNDITGKEVSFLLYYVLALGIPLWIIDRWRRNKTGQSFYNLDLASIRVLLLIPIITIMLQVGVAGPISTIIPMPDFVKEIVMELSGRTGFFSFLAIVIAAPILEEFIFRGIMLDGLLRKYSPFQSILFSSFLFGIIHLNPWQFISAMIIGVFSGWVYYRTRKLLLSIIIHLVNNLFAFLGMLFTDAEQMMDESLVDYYGGPINTIIFIAGPIIIAIACINYLKKEFLKNEPAN